MKKIKNLEQRLLFLIKKLPKKITIMISVIFVFFTLIFLITAAFGVLDGKYIAALYFVPSYLCLYISILFGAAYDNRNQESINKMKDVFAVLSYQRFKDEIQNMSEEEKWIKAYKEGTKYDKIS